MKPTVVNLAHSLAFVTLALAVAAMGFYVASADDAPGAAVMGMLLMVAGVTLGVRTARNRVPAWAARTALAVGLVVASAAAALTHEVVVTAPLFAAAHEVPSVSGTTSPPVAAAVRQAQALVRAAMREQNLPGVSVAVGAGGVLVWAEGFGWRDVATQAPVTPSTRFNIGTAARAVAPLSKGLTLTGTGAEPAAEWSPGHVGEPEEDFPVFTLVRHIVFRPIGLAPAEPLPGERATFYVPRSDGQPRSGRRLMRMRDLACCAEGLAFYSTPSDLVRVAQWTSSGSLDGALAGGAVMSLRVDRESGVTVAVTSNMAHAHTAALAAAVARTFAEAAP